MNSITHTPIQDHTLQAGYQEKTTIKTKMKKLQI